MQLQITSLYITGITRVPAFTGTPRVAAESTEDGPQKARPEWQAANIDSKSLTQMRTEHLGFVAACETVKEWTAA